MYTVGQALSPSCSPPIYTNQFVPILHVPVHVYKWCSWEGTSVSQLGIDGLGNFPTISLRSHPLPWQQWYHTKPYLPAPVRSCACPRGNHWQQAVSCGTPAPMRLASGRTAYWPKYFDNFPSAPPPPPQVVVA